MREAQFTLDWENPDRDEWKVFSGYTNGSKWNGWANPWFTKETAQAVLQSFKDASGYVLTSYDEANDRFTYRTTDDHPDETQLMHGKVFQIEGRPLTLYHFGMCWTWDDMQDHPDESDQDEIDLGNGADHNYRY